MKITSLRITIIVVVLAALVSLNYAYAGQSVFENSRGIVHKGSTGTTIAFPDVCKTPAPGGPIPIPYPNMVPASACDFAKGKKPIKGGGNILIKETKFTTNKGDERAYEVTVTKKSGKKVSLRKSKLFELADGTFCGVCVSKVF